MTNASNREDNEGLKFDEVSSEIVVKTKVNQLNVGGSEISSSNPLPISFSVADLEGIGNLTIGTSQVEITISGTTSTIRVRADNSNTGIIYIGKNGILSDGTNDFIRLESGDEVVISYNDVTNAIYAISDTVSQTINVGALL